MTTETLQSLFIIALTVTVGYQWYVIRQHSEAWKKSASIFVKLYHYLKRNENSDKDFAEYMDAVSAIHQNLHDRITLLEIREENADD